MNANLVAIGDLVEKVKTWNPASLPQPVPIQYIDLSSVDKDAKCIDLSLVSDVMSNEAPSRARQLVKANDILVSTVRPNLNGIALVEKELDGSTASTGYCVLRPSPSKLDPQYLKYWVTTENFVGEMTLLATGASYPAVSDAIIKSTKIPLPPLPTQQRIAAVLDKAQALVANDKQTLARYDQLAKSLFLEMFGDPVRNEKGWDVVKLKEVIYDIVGGESTGGEVRELTNGEWGVLKISAVTSGIFDPSEYKVADFSKLKRDPVIPKIGDLLFSRANTREMVGATCVVDLDCTNVFLPDKLWRIDIDPERTNAFYLHYLLNHEAFRSDTLGRVATGTSGSMLNISKGKLLQIQLPVPDIKLQNDFANAIRRVQQRIQSCNTSLIQSQTLFNSLLQQAFEGNVW